MILVGESGEWFRGNVWKLVLECDSRFEHQQDVVSCGTKRLQSRIDLARIVDRVVDGFSKFSDEILKFLIHLSSGL